MEPLVSIIIPIYNQERYLSQCVDSVLCQTYKNIEIILVDDGSTDSSVNICDRYAESDSRVCVIHKPNGGLVRARKTGLEQSTGDYIMPVDSDDWIEPQRVEAMLQAALRYKCDIVQAGFYVEREDGIQLRPTTIITEGYYDLNNKNCAVLKNLFIDERNPGKRGIQSSLCMCLFSRNLLYEKQMAVCDTISNGEDDICFFPCILSTRNFYIMDTPSYHYRQHYQSMTKTEKFFKIEEVLLLDRAIRPWVESHIAKDILLDQFGRYLLMRLNYHALMKWYVGYRNNYILPYDIIPRKGNVVVYGAGDVGRSYIAQLSDNLCFRISGWIDKHNIYTFQGYRVEKTEKIVQMKYDFILLAALHKATANSMRKTLEGYGVASNNIFWEKPNTSSGTGYLDCR